MSITTKQVAVSGTATLIETNASGFANHIKIRVQNVGSKDCFLGNSGVTFATGYLLAKTNPNTMDDREEFVLGPGESLYAVCSGADSTTVDVLEDVE